MDAKYLCQRLHIPTNVARKLLTVMVVDWFCLRQGRFLAGESLFPISLALGPVPYLEQEYWQAILSEKLLQKPEVFGGWYYLWIPEGTPQNRETCSWCSQVQTGSKARSYGGAFDYIFFLFCFPLFFFFFWSHLRWACQLCSELFQGLEPFPIDWRCLVHGYDSLRGMLGLWIPGCRLPWQYSG